MHHVFIHPPDNGCLSLNCCIFPAHHSSHQLGFRMPQFELHSTFHMTCFTAFLMVFFLVPALTLLCRVWRYSLPTHPSLPFPWFPHPVLPSYSQHSPCNMTSFPITCLTLASQIGPTCCSLLVHSLNTCWGAPKARLCFHKPGT